MASQNSKTIKEIKYKGYIIKVKKDGECFIFSPHRNMKKMTWGENLAQAKWAVNVDTDMKKARKRWNEEDKKAS